MKLSKILIPPPTFYQSIIPRLLSTPQCLSSSFSFPLNNWTTNTPARNSSTKLKPKSTSWIAFFSHSCWQLCQYPPILRITFFSFFHLLELKSMVVKKEQTNGLQKTSFFFFQVFNHPFICWTLHIIWLEKRVKWDVCQFQLGKIGLLLNFGDETGLEVNNCGSDRWRLYCYGNHDD